MKKVYDLRAAIRMIVELLMAQPSSGTPLEKGTQDWEWTEMTDPETAEEKDNEPVTKPKRI